MSEAATEVDYKAARGWLSLIDAADQETVTAAANFHASARRLGAVNRDHLFDEVVKAAQVLTNDLTCLEAEGCKPESYRMLMFASEGGGTFMGTNVGDIRKLRETLDALAKAGGKP